MKKFEIKKIEEKTALLTIKVPTGFVKGADSEHSIRFFDVKGFQEVKDLIALTIEEALVCVAEVRREQNTRYLTVCGCVNACTCAHEERVKVYDRVKVGYNEKDSTIVVYASDPKWVVETL